MIYQSTDVFCYRRPDENWIANSAAFTRCPACTTTIEITFHFPESDASLFSRVETNLSFDYDWNLEIFIRLLKFDYSLLIFAVVVSFYNIHLTTEIYANFVCLIWNVSINLFHIWRRSASQTRNSEIKMHSYNLPMRSVRPEIAG